MPDRGVKVPDHAMVLAAGLGTRMRPVTDDLPKPLVTVGGQTLLDRILDRLVAAGVETAVVNTHHFADRIEDHLAGRRAPRIDICREERLMETGGGVARALAKLGAGPFYVINGDVLWLDGRRSALARLALAWQDADMDALLLVHPVVSAEGYRGPGDFFLDPVGVLRRRREQEVAPFVFTGIQLLHPRLFAGAPEGPFSLNLLYDRAEAAGRLRGIAHDGEWFHIGTPASLGRADAEMGPGPGGSQGP